MTAAVITIDGPSGAGKGSVAAFLAQRLGYHLLDSGAFYRLIALAAQRQQMSWDDEPALAELAANLRPEFRQTQSGVLVYLDGGEVSQDLRSEAVSSGASKVAKLPAVRDALLLALRASLRPPGLVADGRDMGTVVFPDAPLKIFLTADAKIRANRRYKQLIEKGIKATLDEIYNDVLARDARDSGRSVAPLIAAKDAIVLDSSVLSLEETCQQALSLALARSL